MCTKWEEISANLWFWSMYMGTTQRGTKIGRNPFSEIFWQYHQLKYFNEIHYCQLSSRFFDKIKQVFHKFSKIYCYFHSVLVIFIRTLIKKTRNIFLIHLSTKWSWYTRDQNVWHIWPVYEVKCSRGWEWGWEESHSH